MRIQLTICCQTIYFRHVYFHEGRQKKESLFGNRYLHERAIDNLEKDFEIYYGWNPRSNRTRVIMQMRLKVSASCASLA